MTIDAPGDPFNGHVGRLLLLIEALSSDERYVRAMSTVARHDFLLRHPTVLEQVLHSLGVDMPPYAAPRPAERLAIESRMVRYKFGFWDHRYYSLVGRLVALGLVEVLRAKAPIELRISSQGRSAASALDGHSWELTRARCWLLKQHLHTTGNQLGRHIQRVTSA